MRNSVYFWRVEGSGAIVSIFLLRKVPAYAGYPLSGSRFPRRRGQRRYIFMIYGWAEGP